MAVQHYQGSCQCGAVGFEADLDLDRTVTCNCSRCQRLGLVNSFTSPAGFSLLWGGDTLTTYRFNKTHIAHQFCPVCGAQCFARGTAPDGTEMVAVNVNCLEGVDPRALTSHNYDGASI